MQNYKIMYDVVYSFACSGDEKWKRIRFLFIGICNTAFGLICFPLLYIFFEKLQSHYIILISIAQFLATNFSFITHKIIVFRSRGGILKEYIRFFLYQTFLFCLNLGPFAGLVEYCNFNPILAQWLLAAVTMFLSYFYYNRYAFK